MPSFRSYVLATAVFAAVASADTIKITAQSDNTFSPASVTAKQGDVLEFHFQPKNHSVVAGDYQYPCSPVQLGSGFYSGFIDAASGEASKVFRVPVANTNPIAFYSSQGDECPKGMVGIVNPNSTVTLDDYKKRAASLASGVTPGTTSYGGDLADSTSSGGGNGTGKGANGDKSAAGVLRAPAAAFAALVGAMVLFA